MIIYANFNVVNSMFFHSFYSPLERGEGCVYTALKKFTHPFFPSRGD